MEDAFLQEWFADRVEAALEIPGFEVSLRVENQLSSGGFDHVVDERSSKSPVPFGEDRRHPTDAVTSDGFGQYSQVGKWTPRSVDPDVSGIRVDVAPVEFRVCTTLFYDEDVNPQPEKLVEGEGVDLAEFPLNDVRHSDDATARLAWL